MPLWTSAQISRKFADKRDPAFAAMPHDRGRPLETGALAQAQHRPLLQDILRCRPLRLLARLIARLVDLLDSMPARSRIEYDGIGVVQMARGMLLHQVRMEARRIAEYLIVAPTEWNFHPQGALSGLIGLQERNRTRLMETASLFALSLDPCVEFEIEVIHA